MRPSRSQIQRQVTLLGGRIRELLLRLIGRHNRDRQMQIPSFRAHSFGRFLGVAAFMQKRFRVVAVGNGGWILKVLGSFPPSLGSFERTKSTRQPRSRHGYLNQPPVNL